LNVPGSHASASRRIRWFSHARQASYWREAKYFQRVRSSTIAPNASLSSSKQQRQRHIQQALRGAAKTPNVAVVASSRHAECQRHAKEVRL